jgi:AbrB family transcriptional regulator, stage V sporulation protein T
MTYQGKIIKGGKVVLPAALRRELGFREGDKVTFTAEGGAIKVMTPESALRELQAYFAKLVPPGVSMVDELIAERRREVAKEEAEAAEAEAMFARRS